MAEKNMVIKLIETTDTPIISVRKDIAIQNFVVLIGKAFDLLQKYGATCVGSPLSIYHSPVVNLKKTDLEIGFPVRPADNYTRILKGCACASGLHRGDYSSLFQTYKQIAEWIEHQGYTISGPPFEVYLNDPRELPANELLTEVYFPINK
jgi:effector-binding domain-containing protein